MVWLKDKHYTSTYFDPCLYYKRSGEQFILFSVCIDDFLVMSTQYTLIDNLFQELS